MDPDMRLALEASIRDEQDRMARAQKETTESRENRASPVVIPRNSAVPPVPPERPSPSARKVPTIINGWLTYRWEA